MVQLFFFILIGLISVNHGLAASGRSIPILSDACLHAICPFGGVVTLYNLATVGTFIQKIHMSSAILMLLIFALALLFGPVFCGWICPLGTVQEWIGKLGHKLFKEKYNHFVPLKLDGYLRFFRYVVLIWVVFVIARSGQLLFEHIDPYYALFTFWYEEVAVSALVVLFISLAGALFVERPWCKYACPYGALLGIFNKFRIFKIRRNADSCISCGKCDRSCPMNIEVANKDVVNSSQCISCYECTSEVSCPVKETVVITGSRKTKKAISVLAVSIIAFLLVFGGIGATIASGQWSTSNDKEALAENEALPSGGTALDNIRGSNTFQEVADTYKIDIEILLDAFAIPDSKDGTIKIKDLESLYGDTDLEGRKSVQAFVALYTNLPYEPEDVYLPEEAVEILLETNNDLSPEQIEYLESHKVNVSL